MTHDDVLADYLTRIDEQAHGVVRSLAESVVAAQPELACAIKYGLLMFTVQGDWRTWVCAIGATGRAVQLRFLFGVLLDDPLHVLRKGSSVLMTWDLPFDAVVPDGDVRAYVIEAVRRHAEYLADAEAIQAAAKAAGPSTRRR
jgi:uncharacterized protein YdhG (YjbR/CyaY superfamily)